MSGEDLVVEGTPPKVRLVIAAALILMGFLLFAITVFMVDTMGGSLASLILAFITWAVVSLLIMGVSASIIRALKR